MVTTNTSSLTSADPIFSDETCVPNILLWRNRNEGEEGGLVFVGQ